MHTSRNEQGNGLVLALFGLVILAIMVWAGLQVARQVTLQRHATAGQTKAVASLRGVSLSPASYTASGLTSFLGKVETIPHAALEWQGDWQELGQANTGASLVMTNASSHHYTPLLVVSAFKDGGKSSSVPIRPLTDSQIASYVASARNYARTYRPAYFGIGVEVNRIYETSPQNYQLFLDLFHEAVTAIHAVSPDTKVFTTFQLERLRGLRGGLYGGVNDQAKNDWQLVDDFKDADLLAFSSYPGIVYQSLDAIPSDYYSSVAAHTSKPLAFTELGWPAADQAAGWTSSPQTQAGFIALFWSQTAKLPVKFSIWSFMYDQAVSAPFNHLGLVDADGSPRPAWISFTASN